MYLNHLDQAVSGISGVLTGWASGRWMSFGNTINVDDLGFLWVGECWEQRNLRNEVLLEVLLRNLLFVVMW